MTDKDLIAEAKESFQRKQDAEAKNRQNWADDYRFARLGEQWPESVKRDRERDGRPCLTINRLPAFIRQVTNDARQNRPSIKVHPVGDGANQETAEVLNGLIRNIEYSSNADVAYDTALDHAVTGGFGYFRISTDYASDDVFDQDILIERIANPLSVYGDEKSNSADSADWNDAFVTEMYSHAAYEKRWGKKVDKVDFEGDSKEGASWLSDDQVRVAEWWRRDEVPARLLRLSDGMVMHEDRYLKLKDQLDAFGITVVADRPTRTHKVTQYLLSGAEVLETNKWAGRYIPIIPVYGDDVLIDGERTFVSMVRFAKDPQQMFNYWRTASTELVALQPKAPFIGPRGAFNSDAGKWATANTVSHSHIEYDGNVAPQRQSFQGPPAAALQEALNAADDMKSIMGLYDASMGARSNETSGRAIMARQREGDTSTFNFIDNLSRAIRHAGRVIVDLIPSVYNTERIIRVIHEDGTNEKVPVNQPIPPGQVHPKQAQDQQELTSGILKVYDLTTGKYDVTCEVGPSFNTKREEAAAQMIEFIRAYPNAAPIIGDLLAKNLDWPGADDVADRLKAMLPPQIQGQNPQVMQLQQQMQQMDAQAREAVKQLQTQLEAIKADRNIDARKLMIDAFQAETDRMKVIGEQRQAALQTAQQAQADLMAQQAPPAEQAAQNQPPLGGFSLPQ
jgi:hypothetical protein